jgi:hypothetical protein
MTATIAATMIKNIKKSISIPFFDGRAIAYDYFFSFFLYLVATLAVILKQSLVFLSPQGFSLSRGLSVLLL